MALSSVSLNTSSLGVSSTVFFIILVESIFAVGTDVAFSDLLEVSLHPAATKTAMKKYK